MSLEQILTWSAIGGLYAWQAWHSRSCLLWRTGVSREQGHIAAMLQAINERLGKK